MWNLVDPFGKKKVKNKLIEETKKTLTSNEIWNYLKTNNDCILGLLNLYQHQIFSTMKSKENKGKAIDEIVKKIKDFQYNDEFSYRYKKEILD